MKTLFTLLLPILAIATGFAGYLFFQSQTYMLSAFFIVACHLLAALWVYNISSHKKVAMS